MIEVMAQIHMTEAEAARDFHAVLKRVREGAEIVIEEDHLPVAVIRTPTGSGRMLDQAIAIAREREKERGYAVTLDDSFAADVEEIIRNRQPWNPTSWE